MSEDFEPEKVRQQISASGLKQRCERLAVAELERLKEVDDKTRAMKRHNSKIRALEVEITLLAMEIDSGEEEVDAQLAFETPDSPRNRKQPNGRSVPEP